MSQTQYIGQRISYDGAACTVRYIGGVEGTTGTWLGVEWDDAARGKHDGSHKGTRYFTCLSKSPTAASFVRPTRPADPPQSFLSALHERYVADAPGQVQGRSKTEIVVGGKVAQEMGFDKIWRRQSRLRETKIVILDGLRVATARDAGDVNDDGEPKTIGETAPKIVELDLSRNLFERLGPVVEICRDLKDLQKLAINGNRFQNVLTDEALQGAESVLGGVTELQLGETLLSWQELCLIASKCPSLTTLLVGSNQLSTLPPTGELSLPLTLTSINLEYNDFTSLSDIACLTSLKALRHLQLKGNNISAITASSDSPPVVFPPSVQYVDLSYNKIDSWAFVDKLTAAFPGMTGLRITHNPIYYSIDADSNAQSSDESFMFTVARIAPLKTLNFTHISATDRTNAEMFYLSRIAKQLATVPEAAEDSVKALHPRYDELCAAYGEPDVIRREEVNPNFLEARLVTVEFHYEAAAAAAAALEGSKKKKKTTRTVRIPKAFDIYAVKGIVGKMYGLAPLKLRLIWETGEWDPVAGYDEKDGDDDGSDDDEDEEMAEADGDGQEAAAGGGEADDQAGRWVKREVELTDGPKQLGYCVDGLRVRIRVEASRN
ncbi:RNI-like protein [Trichoderma citrinoviride]|uniref:RNI-like protein n=1 Tax=Trichoderma citrinoviride TaxID=58853 RepID=A0A2T4B5C7_9HYPO|nr:RNI-like protein [Trichoderma citrinoviride]PTB64449.1 RNI-like protein [Trichoderma citrinoviride]